VFTDAADSATLRNVVAAEPYLASALHGNFRVLAAGTVRGYGQFDSFHDEWKNIGVSSAGQADLTYINDKLAEASFPGSNFTPEFFQGVDTTIDAAAAYVYDAIFTAGIAACEADAAGAQLNLLQAVRNRSPAVQGVSGKIAFSKLLLLCYN
jgi:hypothetical protein